MPQATSRDPIAPTAKRSQTDDGSPLEALWGRWGDLVIAVLAAGILASLLGPTREQPLWWDEAEYMIRGRHLALGTPETGFFHARPPLLPLIVAAVHSVGLGETSMRWVMLGMLLGSVVLLHRLGRILIGPFSGAVAALLFSVFYVPVFYGARILTDVPQVLLLLAAFLLALDRRLAVAALCWPVFALAIAMRYPAGILLPVVALAYFGTHGLRGREDRVTRALLGLGALAGSGYLAVAAVGGHNPLKILSAWNFMANDASPATMAKGVATQTAWFVETFGPLAVTLSALGAAGLAFRAYRQREQHAVATSAAVLLVAWFGAALGFYGAVVLKSISSDRYLVIALPAFFLLLGAVADLLRQFVPRNGALAAAILAAAILLQLAPGFYEHTEKLVRVKALGFGGTRAAGLWLRDHSEPDDVVISPNVPQLTYYSERSTHPIPGKRREYVKELAERRPRFIVVTNAHPAPQYWQKVDHDRLGYAATARVRGKGGEVGLVLQHQGDWTQLERIATKL